MKFYLIHNWRVAWKFYSVKIQTAVIALAGGWALMPEDWRSAVPRWALVACAALFAFATIGGRVVKQEPKQGGQG